MTTRNFLVPFTRAAVATMLALCCLGTVRATDFVMTTDPILLGTPYFWNDAPEWEPDGIPNGVLDNAEVRFNSTRGSSANITVDLEGSNITLTTLLFNESLISSFNTLGNFINSSTNNNSKLTLNSIIFSSGAGQNVVFGRNIETGTNLWDTFTSFISINGRSQPLLISNVGWTLDFQGPITSTSGVIFAGSRLTRVDPTNGMLNTSDLTLNIQRRDQAKNEGIGAGLRFFNTFSGASGTNFNTYTNTVISGPGNSITNHDIPAVTNIVTLTNNYTIAVNNLISLGDGPLQNQTANARSTILDSTVIYATNLLLPGSGKGIFYYNGLSGDRTPIYLQNVLIGHGNAVIQNAGGSPMTLGLGGGVLTQAVGGVLTFDSGTYSRNGILIDAGLTNLRTGPAILKNSIVVQLNSQSGFGTNATFVINDRAQFHIATNLNAMPSFYLTNGGGALSGFLNLADYAGVGQNVFLSDGATISTNIFGVAGIMPTLAEAGTNRFYQGAPQSWMGLNTFKIAIDPTNTPFKGIAFGVFTDRTPFNGLGFANSVEMRGDIFATNKNSIEILMFPERHNNATNLAAGGAVVFRPATDANGPASLNASNGIANVRGAGSFILQSQDTTNAIDTFFTATNFVINRIAERDVLNFNDVEFRSRFVTNINNVGLSLPTNFVMNLFNARARLENTNAQDSIGGVVNVNTNGLWYTDTTGPTRGRININDYGTLHLRGTFLTNTIITGILTQRTVFAENIIANSGLPDTNFLGAQHIFLKTNAVGAQLLLDVDSGTLMDLTGPKIKNMVTNMDLILSDSSSTLYKGIVIGNGHRLTTALGDNFNLASSGGAFPIGHNATNGTVIISAATLEDGERRQLAFNVPLGMAGANVQFGSTGLYQTVIGGDDTRTVLAPQTGNILVNGAFTGAVVTVVAGTLQIGDGSGLDNEKFFASNITVKAGATLAGSINPPPGAIGNGNTVADVFIEAGGILSPGSAPLRSNEVSRLGAMLIGDATDFFGQRDLHLQSQSILDIQINNPVVTPSFALDLENDYVEVFGNLYISNAVLRLSLSPDAIPTFYTTNDIGDPAAYIFMGYQALFTNLGAFSTVILNDGIVGYIDYNYQNSNLIALVVPEPTTWLLMLAGLCIIGFANRRRNGSSE